MKKIIKKVKTGLKIAASGLLVAATLVAGVAAHQNIKLNDYADDNQINELLEELNCDSSYMKKIKNHYIRMEHNGDEPIYVYFDNTLSEYEKNIATDSLDYVFDILEDINENYKYQVVNEDVYNEKSNKTNIKYSIGDPTIPYNGKDIDVAGLARTQSNKMSVFSNKKTAKDFTILIREDDERKISYEDRLYTYIHELMHLVAFSDVHTLKSVQTTDRYCGNTLMQSSHTGEMANFLTPNDYKALLALYTSKLSDDELISKKEELKEKASNYEKMYYDNFVENVKERFGVKNKITEQNFVCDGEVKSIQIDGTKLQFYYKLKIRENRFQLIIFNENNEQIDKTTGDVFWKDGIAVLKNLELKYGFIPGSEHESYAGGYVENMAVINQGNHIELCNVYTNASFWFDLPELEVCLQN